MENRFNRLTSKEWLPFQKSWFKFDNIEKLYTENLRFFTKKPTVSDKVFYYGFNKDIVSKIANDHDFLVTSDSKGSGEIQYVLIDLLDEITQNTSLAQYEIIKSKVIELVIDLYNNIQHRRFVTVFLPNIQIGSAYYPYAWDLAKNLSTILSIKDEKISCLSNQLPNKDSSCFKPENGFFYCLNFRKDENSKGGYIKPDTNFFDNNTQQSSELDFQNSLPGWFILKPQPRKKNEILHPAKYPELLVEMFVNEFTNADDNVFDPMCGTGSSQIAALRLNRNAYGTELSEFFASIAIERCNEYLSPIQQELLAEPKTSSFRIIQKDARLIDKNDFPEIDYLITSPPYWDMLNMKGAENQAKRIEKGLQTNYSDNKSDLGNVNDYNQFLNDLVAVYLNIVKLTKPGSYVTIVVKNIKKQGSNYPFAWDLSNLLQKELILLPEVFWCQDDISIAPYGYGNTFVSNTFHHYCLNFQVPL